MPRTPPEASSENARRTMQANKRRDTSAELAVRRRLHASGLRYRIDYAADPTDRRRRVDIAFTKGRVAIFIDGCFWHGCPDHYVQPDRKSTRLNSRHVAISYAVFCFIKYIVSFFE